MTTKRKAELCDNLIKYLRNSLNDSFEELTAIDIAEEIGFTRDELIAAEILPPDLTEEQKKKADEELADSMMMFSYQCLADYEGFIDKEQYKEFQQAIKNLRATDPLNQKQYAAIVRDAMKLAKC